MNLPVVDVAVADLRSGNDLFYCAPYNCKLMAKKCVERQAKIAAGVDKADYAWCAGCSLGAQVKALVGEGEPPLPPEHPAKANPFNAQKRAKRALLPALPAPEDPVPEPPAPSVAAPEPEPEPVTERVPTLPPKAMEVTVPKSKKAKAVVAEAMDEAPALFVQERLTFKKLLEGLAIWGSYSDSNDLSDETLEAYTDFFGMYGGELIALSIAALGRLDPKLVGKHKQHLGATQRRVIEQVKLRPGLTTSELAVQCCINYANIRRTLAHLAAQNYLSKRHDPIKAADGWHLGDKDVRRVQDGGQRHTETEP